MKDLESYNSRIEKIVKALSKSRRVLFITGAGISAESGLPTYRGIGGLYNNKETEDGLPVESALSGETIKNNPSLTWKYLSEIESKCRNAKFNLAHEIIAKFESCFEEVLVLTQNIDGFHKQAGSTKIIDIHGDMHKLYCPECDWRLFVVNYSQIEIPPLCPDCNAFIRPDVVFFGEMLDHKKVEKLIKHLTSGFDIYFSIGTTSVFPYIQEPILLAKANNKLTIEINPSKTEVSHLVDIKIPLGAKEALGEIWNRYKEFSW